MPKDTNISPSTKEFRKFFPRFPQDQKEESKGDPERKDDDNDYSDNDTEILKVQIDITIQTIVESQQVLSPYPQLERRHFIADAPTIRFSLHQNDVQSN